MTIDRAVRRLHRDERGQTLLFVLVFIGVMALMIPPLLSLASTGLIASRAGANNARAREAADAGAEYGLDRVRAGDIAAISDPASIPLAPPAANGYGLNVTLQRRPITAIAVERTDASDDCRYRARATDDGNLLPYAVTWTVTPSGSMDQGGQFHGAAGTYTIAATFANLRAQGSFVVGGACP
ncbi:MAG TPA: hypothetical protein VGQ86_01365 [Candidatus Limnocylindria bacterium]|nr:hypothetical protein [Candidatus Limnocylindria bacterium]